MAEIELTELTDIEVVRQDAVKAPASGYRFLIQKATAEHSCDGTCCADCGMKGETAKDVNAVGGIDEKPDIAGAETVIQLLGKLIEAEARELQVCPDEVYDLHTLMEALCLVRCFADSEQWSDEDDGNSLMAKSVDGLIFKAHRKFSSDERTSLASEGKALPDGSYPIPDEDALRRAAILARSGHGDVAGAKRLIAKRAKELGVANPLAEGAQKDTEAVEQTEETSAAGQPQEGAEVLNKDIVAKMIADATAEIVSKAAEERDALAAELKVLKATPIPGGPVLTAPASARDEMAKSEAVRKSAYHTRQAELVQDTDLITYHKRKAAEFAELAN